MAEFTERTNDYLRNNQIETKVWGNSPFVVSRAIMTMGRVYSLNINLWFTRIAIAIDIPQKRARVWKMYG